MTPEHEPPRQEDVQYDTGEEWKAIDPERNKWLGQSKNDTQLWIYLVVKVKYSAVKNNITQEPEMLGP